MTRVTLPNCGFFVWYLGVFNHSNLGPDAMSDSQPTANNKLFPMRPEAHVLGHFGELFVMSHMPSEWIVRKVSYDYGLDLNVEKVDNGRVTGKNFSVQVKALQKRPRLGHHVPVRLKVRTLAYMKERPEPVLLVVYVDADKEAYWIWADEIAQSARQGTDVTVLIPSDRRLTRTDWTAFSGELLRRYRARPQVDSETLQKLDRFGRYSIDLGPRHLLFKEEVDQLENLINRADCTEREIQMFIEQHPGVFVGGQYLRVHGQVRLEGSGSMLIPDFFLEHVSGLCDIMELKLPQATVVAGTATRRRYSAGVHEAAAQSRVYRDFFDEAARRDWFEKTYKLRAFKPRTTLLIGRDAAFKDALEKRELETALHDYTILTYDDLLRMARAQQVA